MRLGELIQELESVRIALTSMGKDAEDLQVRVFGERGVPCRIMVTWTDDGKAREFIQLL